jgi:cellulose synthase operon protein C
LHESAAVSSETLPDLLLVSAHLSRRESAQAMAAIDRLEKKAVNDPLADVLRGRVHLGERRYDDARTSFVKALSKDAQHLPAVAGLALADIAQGKFKEAESRYLEMIKAGPKSATLHMALADLRRQSGAPGAAVVQALEGAINSSPKEPEPRLALIRHHVSSGDIGLALETAQAAASSIPDDADLLLALGELQARSRDHRQAVMTLGKAASLRSQSETPLLKLSEAQRLAGDVVGAERSLSQALQVAPNSMQARAALISHYRQQRKFEPALKLARELQGRQPKNPAGYQWEAEILASQKNHEGAIKAYRRGLDATGGGTLPERLFSLLESINRKDDAERFAAEWQKQNPKDVGLPTYRGNSAFARGDLAAAERFYGDAARIDPGDVVALNNLAWVMAKLGKPGAVAAAERAVAVAPESATVQDTLAYALASEKQFERAIETARQLYARHPTVHKYRLNLARIYAMSGDKVRAASELTELQKLGSKFAEQGEVTSMLATVK